MLIVFDLVCGVFFTVLMTSFRLINCLRHKLTLMSAHTFSLFLVRFVLYFHFDFFRSFLSVGYFFNFSFKLL